MFQGSIPLDHEVTRVDKSIELSVTLIPREDVQTEGFVWGFIGVRVMVHLDGFLNTAETLLNKRS
jgi:hypothetical protein